MAYTQLQQHIVTKPQQNQIPNHSSSRFLTTAVKIPNHSSRIYLTTAVPGIKSRKHALYSKILKQRWKHLIFIFIFLKVYFNLALVEVSIIHLVQDISRDRVIILTGTELGKPGPGCYINVYYCDVNLLSKIYLFKIKRVNISWNALFFYLQKFDIIQV